MPRRCVITILTGQRGHEEAAKDLLRTQNSFACLLTVEFALLPHFVGYSFRILFLIIERCQYDTLVSRQVFGSGKKID